MLFKWKLETYRFFFLFFLLDIQEKRLLFKVFFSILPLVMPLELSMQTDCCTKGK